MKILDRATNFKEEVQKKIFFNKKCNKEILLLKKQLEKKDKKLEIIDESIEFVNNVAMSRRKKVKNYFENIVSDALKLIYGDEFAIELFYDTKNRRSVLKILVKLRHKKSRKTVKRSVEGFGGGVSDVISTSFRILVLTLVPDSSNVLILDESFKHMDNERIIKVGEFIKFISDKMGIQIIMSSHHATFTEFCDSEFLVELDDRGVSLITDKCHTKEKSFLRRMELYNFESHKESIFNFTKGFNLIRGISNTGKSSLVRALKVIGYGEWDKDFVGHWGSKLKIICVTKKGKVIFERGKKAKKKWVVYTKKKGKTSKEVFNNPGRAVPDKVIEVLGFSKSQLGGVNVGVNIASQLDKHFLISEIDGKTVRPSTAAKIIDDLCGVRRVEELVDKIHKDRNILKSEVKKLLIRVGEIEKQKYDSAELKRHCLILKKMLLKMSKLEKCNEKEKKIIEIKNRVSSIKIKRARIEKLRIALRNVNDLSKKLKTIQVLDIKEGKMSILSEKIRKNKLKRKKLNTSIISSSVLKKIKKTVKTVNDSDVRQKSMEKIYNRILVNRDKCVEAEKRGILIKKKLRKKRTDFKSWLDEQNRCPLSKGEFFDVCKIEIIK